jgi:hypothetical protein
MAAVKSFITSPPGLRESHTYLSKSLLEIFFVVASCLTVTKPLYKMVNNSILRKNLIFFASYELSYRKLYRQIFAVMIPLYDFLTQVFCHKFFRQKKFANVK